MNNTLHNGLRLLEYLANTGEARSIKEMAEHFLLPNSHVCRLLKSLVEIGYVEQLPGCRKYRISLKILHLAFAQMKNERLLTIAPPYMRQLTEKVDAAVFVSRAYCGRSLIIATEYPVLFSEIHEIIIGSLHSPASSACGKVCAAYSSEEVRDALLEEIDWNEPGDFQNRRSEFEQELIKIRQQGWAGRMIPHVANAVGVPLFDEKGSFYGALGVFLPPQRNVTEEMLQTVLEATLSCGKLISCAMGCPAAGLPNQSYISKEEK